MFSTKKILDYMIMIRMLIITIIISKINFRDIKTFNSLTTGHKISSQVLAVAANGELLVE